MSAGHSTKLGNCDRNVAFERYSEVPFVCPARVWENANTHREASRAHSGVAQPWRFGVANVQCGLRAENTRHPEMTWHANHQSENPGTTQTIDFIGFECGVEARRGNNPPALERRAENGSFWH